MYYVLKGNFYTVRMESTTYQDLFVAYGVSDVLDTLRLPIAKRIITRKASDTKQKVVQHRFSVRCQIYFRMKLHAVQIHLVARYTHYKA